MQLGTNCILMTCILLYFMSVHTYHSMFNELLSCAPNVVSLKLFTLLTETNKSTKQVPTCLLVNKQMFSSIVLSCRPDLMRARLKPPYYPSVIDPCGLVHSSKFPSWIISTWLFHTKFIQYHQPQHIRPSGWLLLHMPVSIVIQFEMMGTYIPGSHHLFHKDLHFSVNFCKSCSWR